MYITAVVAISLNGFITDGDNPDVTTWTSAEDKAFFRAQKDASDVIIMGKNTFTAMQRVIKLEPNRLRLILTKNPEEFADQVVDDQLEFSNSTPDDLVEDLKKRGFKNVMIAGGSYVYSSFLSAGLINEFKVTVEPIFFASGTPLLSSLDKNYNLELKSSEMLNDRGTMLLSYSVSPIID
ncbi:MAG: dihydrofolate reductase family protein [Candidatus Saccharibacteria bacterium]|nr:dihydrofolate reductase family protein [Candidatus Saccharibacteria bacterium]